MMYLVAVLFGVAVAIIVTLAARLVPTRPRAVARQLAELERTSAAAAGAERQGRQRHPSAEGDARA